MCIYIYGMIKFNGIIFAFSRHLIEIEPQNSFFGPREANIWKNLHIELGNLAGRNSKIIPDTLW